MDDYIMSSFKYHEETELFKVHFQSDERKPMDLTF
jgi:hypothetical protein